MEQHLIKTKRFLKKPPKQKSELKVCPEKQRRRQKRTMRHLRIGVMMDQGSEREAKGGY